MRTQHSKSTSFRLDQDLQQQMHEWLDHNPGLNMSRLINMAIRQFITEEQVLVSVKTARADDKKVIKTASKMMKKHAHMLKKLK